MWLPKRVADSRWKRPCFTPVIPAILNLKTSNTLDSFKGIDKGEKDSYQYLLGIDFFPSYIDWLTHVVAEDSRGVYGLGSLP